MNQQQWAVWQRWNEKPELYPLAPYTEADKAKVAAMIENSMARDPAQNRDDAESSCLFVWRLYHNWCLLPDDEAAKPDPYLPQPTTREDRSEIAAILRVMQEGDDQEQTSERQKGWAIRTWQSSKLLPAMNAMDKADKNLN